jgi:hypothetical protein
MEEDDDDDDDVPGVLSQALAFVSAIDMFHLTLPYIAFVSLYEQH